MKNKIVLLLGIFSTLLFFPFFPAEAEIIYMKDGQVLDGAIIHEDSKQIKVETEFKTWTIKKKHIKRIMYGKRKMERIYILMMNGTIIKGYLVDQDNEKIIIRHKKDSAKERTIFKRDIKQMSPKEIKLFEPEIMLMGGMYYPIDSGGAELAPGALFFAAFEFNLTFIKHMRLQIEAGFSQCDSNSNDGLSLQIIPLKFNLQYFFKLKHITVYPRLGFGGTMVTFKDGEGGEVRGYKPLAHGGAGVLYELISKTLYARANLDYAMLFDNGNNLSNLFLSVGFGVRF